MPKKFILSSKVHQSAPDLSHAVLAGNTLYLSGQTGRDKSGKLAAGIEAQIAQALENIGAVLAEAGASFADVVKILTFATHADFHHKFMEMRTRYLKGNKPAMTGIVASFPAPDILVEVDIIAYLGSKRFINPPSLFDPSFRNSSHGVLAGNVLHTRGQTSRDKKWELLGVGDIETQVRISMEYIEAIIKEAGGTMQDLVKVDNYISHTSFLQPVLDYRKRRYPSVRPASTTVAAHFPFPNVLEEIDAWAYLGPKEYINPKTVFDTAFRGSSQAVKAGDTLYLTGQTARDIKTQIVGKGDIKAQTVQVFENIKNILEGAGATFDNVVKLLIFVSHPTHLAVVREVRSRYLKGNRPAIATVMVDFSDPNVLVEVDTWAYLG